MDVVAELKQFVSYLEVFVANVNVFALHLWNEETGHFLVAEFKLKKSFCYLEVFVAFNHLN